MSKFKPSARERLQKKLQENRQKKLEQDLLEHQKNILKSNNIEEIREAINSIINLKDLSETKHYNEILKKSFPKYLTTLNSNILSSNIDDLKNINKFLSIEVICTPENKTELMRFISSYENLPQTSQTEEIWNSIEGLYHQKYSRYYFDRVLSFEQAIKNKSYVLAQVLYKIIKDRGDHEGATKSAILNYAREKEFDSVDFSNLIKEFHIDITKLSYSRLEDNIKKTFTPVQVIIPYIRDIWSSNREKAQSLLNYFVKEGLPLDAEVNYNNALAVAMVPKKPNLDFIKTLLELNIIDVNRVMTSIFQNTVDANTVTTSVLDNRVGANTIKTSTFGNIEGADTITISNFNNIKAANAANIATTSSVANKIDDNTAILDNIVDVKTPIISTILSPSSVTMFLTLFSLAVGKVNFDLISLLLEYNATPYLASNLNYDTVKDKFGVSGRLFITQGLSKNLPLKEDQEEYIIKLDRFIENFYFSKLVATQKVEMQQNAAKESGASSSSQVTASRSELEKFDDISDSSESGNTLNISQEASDKLFQYIKYKEGAQNNKALPAEIRLEHKFDNLLLKWLQSISEDSTNNYVLALRELLDEHPSLNSYSAKCLLNRNVSADVVMETFADKPKLLHKFFSFKKQAMKVLNVEKIGDIKLQEGVYELKCGFENKMFVKIPIDILKELDRREPGSKDKILELLPNIHFIKSTSKDEAGIKIYPGCYKLKIIRNNYNLYAKEQQQDANGNILVIFKEIGNHKGTPYKGKFTTFSQEFSESIYTTAQEKENGGASCQSRKNSDSSTSNSGFADDGFSSLAVSSTSLVESYVPTSQDDAPEILGDHN